MTLKNRKGGDLNISASAIDTFGECRRKWWYGYVERIRGPKNESAARGEAIHDLAERYLKGHVTEEGILEVAECLAGRPIGDQILAMHWEIAVLKEFNTEENSCEYKADDIKWWRYLKPGLPFAPTPDDVALQGWGVEDWVKEPCGPLNFVGKVDFYNCYGLLGGNPTIDDWKSTKFPEWDHSKTPTQLATIFQPRVYAYSLLKDDPPEFVDFHHVNVQSRGKPDAMEVWARNVSWESILDTWQEVIKIAEDMAEVYHGHEEANEVEPSISACGNYGGCEHAAICPASPQNFKRPALKPLRYTGKTPMSTPSAQDRIAAMRARAGITSAAPTPPAITPTPKKAPPGRSLADNLKATYTAMPGGVPIAVAVALSGNDAEALTEALTNLGLSLQGDVYKTGTQTEARPSPWRIGQPWDGTPPPNTKIVAGILVPEDFEGGAVEAVLTYSTNPEARAAAQALDEVEAPAPEEKQAPTTSPSPVPKDLETRKAARVIISLLETFDTVDVGDASDAVKKETTWKRISGKRWGQVADLANAWLADKELAWTVEFSSSTGFSRVEAAQADVAQVTHFDPEAEEKARVASPLPPEQAKAEREEEEEFYRDDDTPEITCQDLLEARDEGKEEGYEQGKEEGLAQGKEEGYSAGYAQGRGVVGTDYKPTVYIGCRPLQGEVIDFANWVAPFEQEVAEDNNLPYYGLIGFNEGIRFVAGKVLQYLDREGPSGLPSQMTIDTFHPCAAGVIALLAQLKGSVDIVQAVR